MKNLKKSILCIFCALGMFFCLTTPINAAGRKIISKSVYGSMTLWSAYTYNYHFTAHAVLSYNNSNNITQISDLSFSNTGYTASQPSLSANFIPTQKSKSYSGSSATYVVTLTRTVYGYYTDKIDYYITYRVSDAGSPYSLTATENEVISIDIQTGTPYDIEILSDSSN